MTTSDFYLDRKLYYGRPIRSAGPDSAANPIDRIPQELACYDLLDSLGILYTRADHACADTIEACHAVEQVLGAPICKNLFLCNLQKTQFYLLMMEGDKVFKTKDLSKQLGVSRLSFAGPEDMMRLLGVTPGSVTVLGLMNDKEQIVQLVMDKPVAESETIGCHPCINTSTIAFPTADLVQRLLPAVAHEAIVVDLPIPEEDA